MQEKIVTSYRQYLAEQGELDSHLKQPINALKQTWFNHISRALHETGANSDSRSVRSIILNCEYGQLLDTYCGITNFDQDTASAIEQMTDFEHEYLLSLFSGPFLDETVTVRIEEKAIIIEAVGT